MHISQVIASVDKNSGGTAQYISDISRYLPTLNIDFSLVTSTRTPSEDLTLDSRFDVRKVQVQKHDYFGQARQSGFSKKLTQLNCDHEIDLVHLHGIWMRPIHSAIKWSMSNDKPFVVSPHGMLEPWALDHKRRKKMLAWMLYQKRDLQHATAFHATAYSEAESIRRLGFKQPIAVIPNGVQLPEAVGCESIKFQKSEGAVKTALFLSRLHPKKGLPMLLDAWKKFAPKDWRLVIAGNDDGGHASILQAQIKRLGLNGDVEVVGPLFGVEKEQAYLSADLFLLPSYSENFGIVVTEALGYNLPVLTTTGCPWGELETERCGWWVDPSPVGIEQGLSEAFATEADELVNMGQRGRGLVETKYQWPGIADKMSEFYKWLLDGGQTPEFVM